MVRSISVLPQYRYRESVQKLLKKLEAFHAPLVTEALLGTPAAHEEQTEVHRRMALAQDSQDSQDSQVLAQENRLVSLLEWRQRQRRAQEIQKLVGPIKDYFSKNYGSFEELYEFLVLVQQQRRYHDDCHFNRPQHKECEKDTGRYQEN